MKFGISTISKDTMNCAYAIVVLLNGKEIEIPTLLDFNYNCDWGETNYNNYIDILPSEISYIDIAWKSLTNESYFKKKITDLSSKICNLSEKFQQNCTMKVGITPYGIIALWIENSQGQRELLSMDEVTSGIEPNKSENYKIVLKQFAHYSYRFVIYESINNCEKSPYLKVLGFDGAKQYYNDSKMYSNFQMRGIPSKILMRIENKGFNIQTFIWFDLCSISGIFEKFYGTHPETKSDFIIRIDSENKKYELALYRQGLKEPVVIPESAYQLIVFKNKFEDYRSENYDQPRGAWIW